jgi:peptidoglycan/LPS O-acetylase OafA/YrhL
MRFAVLDGWRGVAALSLVFIRFDTNGTLTFAPFVRNTYLFVDFFFVLSGFVIAHTYGNRLTDKTSLIAFAIKRFGRLWPLHAFMLLLYVLVLEAPRWLTGAEAFVGKRAPITIFENLALIHALGFTGPGGWNTPSWSISTELWTYFVFALVVALAPTLKSLIAALLVVVGLAIVMLFSTHGMDVTHDYGFARCVAGFFAGVLTYEAWLRTRATPPSRGVLAVAEVVLGVAVIAFVAIADKGPLSFAAPALFALVVWVFAHEAGPMSRVLATRPVQALGAWSYSIYMIALFVGELTSYALRVVDAFVPNVSFMRQLDVFGDVRYGLDTGVWWLNDLGLVIFVAVVVALSSLTFRFIEEPARRWFNRAADGFTARQRVAATVGKPTA